MVFPESLIHYWLIIVLLKTILRRSPTNCNITRKTCRKFRPWHVISPLCLHQVFRIRKSLYQLPTVPTTQIPFPFDQELSLAILLPEIKDGLKFPLVFVVD